MSKIQEAIRASKEQAQNDLPERRRVSTARSSRNVAETRVRLDHIRSLDLDPEQMERSCLLPFLNAKGAESAYKLLRTRLLKRMRDNQWKSLMVTGTLPGEGKTTTAINLAIGISQDVGQLVVLVDLDLQRPAIAGYLGLEPTTGLSDYILGDAEPSDVLYNTDVERLIILPNFEPIQISEMLVSQKMLTLLDYILQLDRNMVVIFDMPPVLNSDAVLAFGPYVDALLFIVSEGRTNRGLLQRARQMIEEIPMIGTVLTRSSEGNAGSYY
jgi:Mrp family chromosome partitioning ATPase